MELDAVTALVDVLFVYVVLYVLNVLTIVNAVTLWAAVAVVEEATHIFHLHNKLIFN